MAVFLLPAILFMAATFLLPLVVVAYTSISGEAGLTLEHYRELFSRPLYAIVLKNTLEISVLSTALTLLLGYPIAYHLSRQSPARRGVSDHSRSPSILD